MDSLVNEILEKISLLNLSLEDDFLSKKIILIAINSVKNFIKSEIDVFIDFSIIKETFIDIVIGEYLLLIKLSNIDNNIDIDNVVKTIKEGDVSITYFENKKTFDNIIEYFLDKKKLLYNYKKIVW